MASVGDLLQLTRKDMAGFPEQSVKYVLELQKKDWKATRSNRSHIAVMSPDGMHRFGLSQKEGGLAYLKRDVKKYYAARGEEENEVVEKKVTQKFPCPRPECNKVYASLEHLDTHIAVDHEKQIQCAEPGCLETFKTKQVMGRHRQVKHGYQSPRYKERKAQEARRAQKKAEEEITESREETADTNAMIDYLQADAEATASIKPDLTVSMDFLQHYTELGMKPPQIGESVGTPAVFVNLRGEDIDESQMAYFVEREPQPGEEPHVNVIRKETPAFEKDELLKQAEVFGIENPDLLRSIQEHARIDDWEAEQRALRADANRLQEERDLLVEEIDFIDTRDSWTLNLKDILERRSTVEEVVTMMAAAGLGLEIRVWKI